MRRLIDWFLGREKPQAPTPPALRNKAGGMAWIKNMDTFDGSDALNGRAVRTVRLRESGCWEIEPTQSFIAACNVHYLKCDRRFDSGQAVHIDGITDECLEPWKDTGLRQEDVSELYAPGPAVTKTPAPVASIRGH